MPYPLYCLDLYWVCPHHPVFSASGDQGSFCMIHIMQNHVAQVFANSGSRIELMGFVRDPKSKNGCTYCTPLPSPPIAVP